MIIDIVQLPIPPRAPQDALASAKETAPRFRELSDRGLLKKYYLNGPAGGGGVYVWRSRAEAEAWYSPEWYEQVREMFGVTPHVSFYDSLVQVDNERGEVLVQPASER